MLLKQIGILFKHELNLEIRQKHFINSVLLYVISTIFVCYLSFQFIESVKVWNTLLWIIILFTLTNAISKSFINENSGKQIFLYTLVNPRALIVSKLIYNIILSVLLSVLTVIIYNFMFGSEILDKANFPMYFASIALGSMGFASVLTMVSAIAGKTGNNIGLIAILGFPLMIPTLILAIKFSDLALKGFNWSISFEYIFLILLINVLIIALSFLLFPYLWRE